jgi:hypothetical protein
MIIPETLNLCVDYEMWDISQVCDPGSHQESSQMRPIIFPHQRVAKRSNSILNAIIVKSDDGSDLRLPWELHVLSFI